MNREANTITKKLLLANIELGKPIIPIANYIQTKIVGGKLYVAGQLPSRNGDMAYKGRVGKEITVEEGIEAAKLCMVNTLSQVSMAVNDDCDAVISCIKLEIYVNCEHGFERHSEVANGASDLLVTILGDKGKHVRIAVGVCSLPLNAAVEVTSIFEIAKQENE